MSRAKLATGHTPSPYLRRFRLPNLNTLRPHEDPLSPEDEYSKLELIQAKMMAQQKSQKAAQINNYHKSTSENTAEVQQKPFYHPQRIFEEKSKEAKK